MWIDVQDGLKECPLIGLKFGEFEKLGKLPNVDYPPWSESLNSHLSPSQQMTSIDDLEASKQEMEFH